MSFRALGPSRDWSAPYTVLQKSCSAMLWACPSFCRLKANMKSKFALSSPPSFGGCRVLFLSCLSCSSTEGKKIKQYSRYIRDVAIPHLKFMPSKYSSFTGIYAGTKEAQASCSHRTPNMKSAVINVSIISLLIPHIIGAQLAQSLDHETLINSQYYFMKQAPRLTFYILLHYSRMV